MTDVLFVAVDRTLVNRVSALPGHRVVSIDHDNAGGARKGQSTETFHPDLIFVGSGLSLDNAIKYARVVLGDFPEISVVLVAEPDKSLIRKARSAGILGVVPVSISDKDLTTLVARAGRASTQAPEALDRHQVIVVASPKGGVGKTTTAISVAALLAESAPGQVVVIDLDLQFGDIGTMLDITPEYTITDAFASGGDSMLLRTLLMPHPANFFVLCGSDNPAENGRVSGDQIRKVISQYSSIFRYVVIDTAAGLLEEALASLEEATDVVFVATLDVATLRSVRREIDVLDQLSLLPERRHILLNRTDRRSGLTARDAEQILGRSIDVEIAASDRIPLAANRGELVTDRKRNPVRQSFTQLARKVSDLTTQKGDEAR